MSRNAVNELYKRVYGRDAFESELDLYANEFGEVLDSEEAADLENRMVSVPGYTPPVAQEQANVLEGIPETFVDEITEKYQTKLDRLPTPDEIAFYAREDQYGTDAISPEESARFDNAVRIEKSKDRGFDSSVVDFFRRTVDRDPTQAELLAYAANYKKPDADGGYSFDKQEQNLSRQNLLEERQQKFGLGDQIAALHTKTFGENYSPDFYETYTDPTTGETSTEAAQFFQKLGGYGSDPRRITARDAQKFKEQILTPKQLAKIPMNYANMSPTNLPTSFLAPNSPLPAVGADGLPVPTGSLPNVAITGGVAPLPTGAPTTAPKMVDVTAPVVNTTPAGYKRGGTVEVNMNRGGDPVLEMMRQRDTDRASRARDDLNRLMNRNQTQGFENGGEVKKKLL